MNAPFCNEWFFVVSPVFLRLFALMELNKKAFQRQVAADGVLDLSFQELTEVPEWVWTLTHLRSLNLSNNHIAELRLPSVINCPALESIDLSFNELTEVPENLADRFGGDVTFQFLDLRFNKLKRLPEEFFAFFEKKELRFCVMAKRLFNSGMRMCPEASDANWGGWHGKKPKEGFMMLRTGNKRYHMHLCKVSREDRTGVGFRIGFAGNKELEADLRRDLGMEDGESFDSERVKELLQERAQQNADTTLADALDSDDSAKGVEERKVQKEQKHMEREQAKKGKEKAIKREEQAKSRQKAFQE